VAWRKPREGKTEDQLIRTSSVLRRSTPVGPQGSKPGQHHACASPLPSLPFLPPAFSLSLPPPSFPPSLPPSLSLSLSLSRLSSLPSLSLVAARAFHERAALMHTYTQGARTQARVRACTASLRSSRRFPAIFLLRSFFSFFPPCGQQRRRWPR